MHPIINPCYSRWNDRHLVLQKSPKVEGVYRLLPMKAADIPKIEAADTDAGRGNQRRRTLVASCGAHILHDGYSDLLYVLLPIWQTAFGLSFIQVGLLKTSYSGAMAGLQIPSSLLAERLGERQMLVAGTLIAATSFLLAGLSGSFVALAIFLVIGGAGASVQHPLGSALIARTFEGKHQRAALSAYNFSGDLGKMLLPAAVAGIIAVSDWNSATLIVGALGLFVAAVIYLAIPGELAAGAHHHAALETPAMPVNQRAPARARQGFYALSAIGIIDSATRTGFLTFLPFLLTAKGASVPQIGLALALVFAGGAAGKFMCGLIAIRAGILRTVIITECVTAAGIIALLPLSIPLSLVLLPVIGVALNGTSSVLYGTVAELVPAQKRSRAFGIFYTFTIGAGALSPTLYGAISDVLGVPRTLVLIALIVLVTVPLTALLRPVIVELSRAQ